MSIKLSNIQLAAIKRTAQTVQVLKNKKQKVVEKIAALQASLDEYDSTIASWEEPITKLTGGLTSEQVLADVTNQSEEEETPLPASPAVVSVFSTEDNVEGEMPSDHV